MRVPIPEQVQADVLLRSRRRCCICFGLHHDMTTKAGQIAHLDRNNGNAAEDNLAFLCLAHHDEYDSRTSQRKALSIREVKAFREELLNAITSLGLVQGSASKSLVPPHGGRGGSGEIFGDGTVIGGRGGRVGVGGQGRGGHGGGGVVHGNGLVIGGNGGEVDGANVWFPPARSGYDHYLAGLGETPDWGVMYPGYGGMSPGYLQRHRIVQAIRSNYFKNRGITVSNERSKIHEVPIEYVNSELKSAGFDWRAEQEGHWYIYRSPAADE